MKICSNCQQENPKEARFCNNCGTSLEVSSTAQPVSSGDKKGARSAERRQLTILFCDLVGSTALSEGLDPEEFRQVITKYHQVAEKVIQQYNGSIAQYLGDGLLVYFGYPEGLEDAPKLGIQAGLGILKALSEANQRWKAEGNPTVKLRIGIHTGLVVVDEHMALGETVNIAARLEGLAPHNGLVITPQTLSLVEGWFEVESIGKHRLKGITEPLEIYQVSGESGAKTRLDIAKSKGLSPLVGRQHELSIIAKCWEKAKKGAGNLLLLRGEAGIGKSRLVDTIEDQVVKDNGMVAVARCSAYQRNSAFYPLIELIEKTILQFDTEDNLPEKQAKLERFLLQTNMDVESSMSLFSEFLSISSEQYPPLVISPVAKRQRVMEGISQVLLAKSGKQPLLLVIEDLHWIDASTSEWLKKFIEELSPHSVFTLCTARPSFQEDWEGQEEIAQLDLKRLSEEHMADISRHQCNGKDLPEEILEQISQKTEGVPLFVEELTKMILESEMVVENKEGYEVVGSLSSIAIPSTLQDSLLARLDRLSDVKDIVQIGSVLGREFSFEMLSAVTPQKELTMDLALSKLLDAEILYRHGHGKNAKYQFKHALIQDAAYESQLKSRRQQLHHRVANVLEQQFADIAGIQPELVAHHYTEAGLPIQAIPLWLKAGQSASKQNATFEAITHLEKGVELLSHVENEGDRNNLELDFRLTLGGSYVVTHGFPHPKVKETFDRARDLAQDIEISPKVALIQLNLLSYYFNTEDYKSVDKLSADMLELSKHPQHGYWFELFATHLSCGAVTKGEFPLAQERYEKVMEMFDPSLPFPWELTPSGYIVVASKGWSMVCLQILGYMDQAKRLSNEQIHYAKDHNDSTTLYHIYTFPALYGLEAREWKEAEKILNIYLPMVKAFGDPIFTLTAEVYYYMAKAFLGDRPAFDTAVNLVNVCFNVGFKTFAVCMSSLIGEQYFIIGEYQAALDWIEKMLKHVDQSGTHIHTAELYRIRGLTLQALGEEDEVIENCFLEALEISRRQAAKTFELRAASDLARFRIKQHRGKEASELLSEVYHWFTEGLDSVDLLEARKLLDQITQD